MPSVGLNIVFGAPSAPRTKKVLVAWSYIKVSAPRNFVKALAGGFAASD
jgi:hypothetical protein